jgi:hypothetical protein
MSKVRFGHVGLWAVLGLAANAWAFCPEEDKKTQAAQSGSPCPHAASDGSAVKAADPATAEKSGGCAKKDCCKNKGTAEKSGGCSKPCSKGAGEGPASAILASLPSMKYRVGSETTCCSKSAEEMAAKAGQTITYVVGEQTFEKKNEATLALAKVLEAEMEKMLAVQSSTGAAAGGCPHAAKEAAKQGATLATYKVGGIEYTDQQKAERAAKLAAEAAANVKMSYKVGDEKFCCDRMAGTKAKEVGKTVTFVVGEEETCCQDMAKLLVVQAKIKAIVEAATLVQNS